MSEILTKAGIDGQSFCWKLFQNLRSDFSDKSVNIDLKYIKKLLLPAVTGNGVIE